MNKKIPVGVLGCTGLVGQRFIELLSAHPVFTISKIFGRPEKKGIIYYDAVNWVCESKLDPKVAELEISSIEDYEAYKGLSLVFSGLPAEVADKVEGELRKRGLGVVSNARSYRLDKEVPLLVPEINISAIELVETQKKKYNGGFIATNPNCSAIGIALAVGPIEKAFGIESLHIVTMQARSGAGLSGLSSTEMTANVIPNIGGGEEDKIRNEIPKILSRSDISIKVRVNRVPVVNGHTFNIWFKTKKKTTKKELIDTWKNFKPECGLLPSISGGDSIYKIYDEDFMPQPKIDALFMGGMGTAIGRIEALSDNEFCITAVSNNIIRGAAGGTVLIAEILNSRKML